MSYTGRSTAAPPAGRRVGYGIGALGTMLTTGVGLAAIVAMWRVFPFDFDGSSTWELVARILLGIAAIGSAIGFVVALAALRRSPPRPRPAAGSASG